MLERLDGANLVPPVWRESGCAFTAAEEIQFAGQPHAGLVVFQAVCEGAVVADLAVVDGPGHFLLFECVEEAGSGEREQRVDFSGGDRVVSGEQEALCLAGFCHLLSDTLLVGRFINVRDVDNWEVLRS